MDNGSACGMVGWLVPFPGTIISPAVRFLDFMPPAPDFSRLALLGWNDQFAQLAAQQLEGLEAQKHLIARVVEELRGYYTLHDGEKETLARIAGKLRHEAAQRIDFPAVGDWVTYSVRPGEKRATLHSVLPRLSKFSRQAAGDETEEQLLAANLNTVFIVTSLNRDLNARRLERYLTLVMQSGAAPVVILNKTDICDEVAAIAKLVRKTAGEAPVIPISALKGRGVEKLKPWLAAGQTVALLGSSGAGKSTLVNRLLGEDRQVVRDIRGTDDRGRHTTTSRHLFVLPGGGMVIDTPGLRELHMWDGEEGIAQAFTDVEEIALKCKFTNCRHEKEPGCAVQAARTAGKLSEGRFAGYQKLRSEIEAQKSREEKAAKVASRVHWRKLHQSVEEADAKTKLKHTDGT
ncbi:MAG TPA: ribosome small subunit-dependent GTPase A [Candidatus Methylacidiphilales bacterium]|nr:ribosome small subunit-dependent GTPase A [Candidatus Methylacidiphilales bacterium]